MQQKQREVKEASSLLLCQCVYACRQHTALLVHSQLVVDEGLAKNQKVLIVVHLYSTLSQIT